MLAFLFSEDKKDVRIHFIILIVAFGFLIIGWKFVIADMKTTALFYDNIGMQLVYSERDQIFPGTSTEGAIFGIAISIWQIYCGYKIAMENNANRRKTWWIVRIASGIFDTYTDVGYRSFTFDNWMLTLNTLAVSIFVYNLFSEVIVSIGFKEVVGNLYTVPAIFRFIFNGEGHSHNAHGGGKPNFPPGMPPKQAFHPPAPPNGKNAPKGAPVPPNPNKAVVSPMKAEEEEDRPLPGDIKNLDRFGGDDFNAGLRKPSQNGAKIPTMMSNFNFRPASHK